MNFIDMFKTYVGAYYGVTEMDEYPLKEYVLYDLKEHIQKMVMDNQDHNISFIDLAQEVEKLHLKTKLQDCLIVLPKLNVSLELLHLIKMRLRTIREEECQF